MKMEIKEQTTEKLIILKKLIEEELISRKIDLNKTICKIRGVDNALDFKKNCDVSEVKEICQDIWDNPDKYSDHKKDSESAYYDFLKFLYVKYPDGKELHLTDVICM